MRSKLFGLLFLLCSSYFSLAQRMHAENSFNTSGQPEGLWIVACNKHLVFDSNPKQQQYWVKVFFDAGVPVSRATLYNLDQNPVSNFECMIKGDTLLKHGIEEVYDKQGFVCEKNFYEFNQLNPALSFKLSKANFYEYMSRTNLGEAALETALSRLLALADKALEPSKRYALWQSLAVHLASQLPYSHLAVHSFVEWSLARFDNPIFRKDMLALLLNFEKKQGKNSNKELSSSLHLYKCMAQLHWQNNQVQDCQTYIHKAEALLEKSSNAQLRQNREHVIESKLFAASFYLEMGDFKLAEELYEEMEHTPTLLSNINEPMNAYLFAKLGQYYLSLDNLQKAKQYSSAAMTSMELGSSLSLAAVSIAQANLGILLLRQNEHQEAQQYCQHMIASNLEDENTFRVLIALGAYYRKNGRIYQALSTLKKAEKINFSKKTYLSEKLRLQFAAEIGLTQALSGNTNEAKRLMSNSLHEFRELLVLRLPLLSPEQRAGYLVGFKGFMDSYREYCLLLAKSEPQLLEDLLQLQFYSKLSPIVKGLEDSYKNGLGQLLRKLLSYKPLKGKKSKASPVLTDALSFQKIKKGLKEGEAYVDVVRTEGFYGFLIIKKDSKRPEISYVDRLLLECEYPSSSRCIHMGRSEEKSLLQEHFWKACKRWLGDCKEVYFCPDGIFNFISANTLAHSGIVNQYGEKLLFKRVETMKDKLYLPYPAGGFALANPSTNY